MSSKEYFEMQISVDGFSPDILSGVLFMLGCSGIQEISDSKWVVFFGENFSTSQLEDTLAKLKELNSDFNEKSLKITKLPVKDWNEEWKKYFKPFRVLENLWIRPPWEKMPLKTNEIEIVIDPQMAFGTGHHESTALMLEALLKYPVANKPVLDVGTGSGILAILALKLGANHIMAIDNDPDSISNAEHNFGLNDLVNVHLILGQITDVPDGKYSLIMANINYAILNALPMYFLRLLDSDGRVIISGILKEDRERVSFFYEQAGFAEVECLSKNEWIAMVWKMA
jgi:ribosomal protein L11 methyltransferase